jgi:hypothetical protein
MSKYCSAGKIECEVYSLDNSASGYCQASFVDRRWEQCPWPSRQRPVEKRKYTDCARHLECENAGEDVCDRECRDFKPIVVKAVDDGGSAYLGEIESAYDLGKAAGINEGVERAKMAIRSCSRCEIEKYTICRERIAACKVKP